MFEVGKTYVFKQSDYVTFIFKPLYAGVKKTFLGYIKEEVKDNLAYDSLEEVVHFYVEW